VSDFGKCDRCHQQLIEIDHYGERLIGCVECNRWSWCGCNELFMTLPEEDLEACKTGGAHIPYRPIVGQL
jgi:hypothetical protein